MRASADGADCSDEEPNGEGDEKGSIGSGEPTRRGGGFCRNLLPPFLVSRVSERGREREGTETEKRLNKNPSFRIETI